MLRRFFREARKEAGFTRTTVLAVVAAVCVAAAGGTYAVIGSAPSSGDAAAKGLAGSVAQWADMIASDNDGSYAGVGLLSLHKRGQALITRSTTHPWVSFVSAGARTYTVTVTAEPTGDSFTVSRSVNGTVTRTCTLANGTDASACVNGTW